MGFVIADKCCLLECHTT